MSSGVYASRPFHLSYHSFIIVFVYFANAVNELAVHKADDLVAHLLEILECELNSLATILLVTVMNSDIGDIEDDGKLYHKTESKQVTAGFTFVRLTLRRASSSSFEGGTTSTPSTHDPSNILFKLCAVQPGSFILDFNSSFCFLAATRFLCFFSFRSSLSFDMGLEG